VQDVLPNLKVEGMKTKLSFVPDVPQKVKMEDVKTKLSCETSLKSARRRFENEAFVKNFPQKV